MPGNRPYTYHGVPYYASPGNQVAVAAGTALEFRLAKPLSVDVVG